MPFLPKGGLGFVFTTVAVWYSWAIPKHFRPAFSFGYTLQPGICSWTLPKPLSRPQFTVCLRAIRGVPRMVSLVYLQVWNEYSDMGGGICLRTAQLDRTTLLYRQGHRYLRMGFAKARMSIHLREPL